MKKVLKIMCLVLISTVSQAATEAFPSFTLKDINSGVSVSLSDVKGKVVLVDFWAQWCIPCKVSFGAYQRLYQKYKGDGLVILAVNTDSEIEKAKAFLEDRTISFTVLQDGKELAGQLNIREMPTSYLLDKGGAIVRLHSGFVKEDEAELEAEIRKLLGK